MLPFVFTVSSYLVVVFIPNHVVGIVSLHSLAGAAIGGFVLFWVFQMFFSSHCVVPVFASVLANGQIHKQLSSMCNRLHRVLIPLLSSTDTHRILSKLLSVTG